MKIIAFCLGCWLAIGFFSLRGDFDKDSVMLAFGQLKNRLSTLVIPQPLNETTSIDSVVETLPKNTPQTDIDDESATRRNVDSPKQDEDITSSESPQFKPELSQPLIEFDQWQEPTDIEDVVNPQQEVAIMQYHPLWSSFTTRSSAQGFVSSVQRSSGIFLDVHTLGIGNYQVMLPYSTPSQLHQNLAQINDRMAIAVE